MSTKFLVALTVLLVAVLGIAIAVLVLTVQLVNQSNENNAPAPIETDFVVVQTTSGQLRGRKVFTVLNQRPYFSFRGIPYAQPPIGELRLRPPQAAQPWSGVRDAFEYGNICFQPGGGDEDCLFINVHTPANFNPGANLPVLVAFHGGAFIVGSGQDMGPDLLLNVADMVVVSFNYRLGVLGYLSLRTPEYSGNMGLKDQLLALKWTNENIHHFGGNRNRITLSGVSAGSASAHMLALSPAGAGLFQRLILSSGSALNHWAFTYIDAVPTLNQFAIANGATITNQNDLIEFLKTVDKNLLASSHVDEIGLNNRFWVPCIEPANTVDPIFLRSPNVILADNFNTDVETMFGFASHEGYFFVDDEFRNPAILQPLNALFQTLMPMHQHNQNLNFDTNEYRALAAQIRTHYYGNQPIDATTLYARSAQVSEVDFAYSIDRSAKLMAAASSGRTFYYRFSVDGRLNAFKITTIATQLGFGGATHSDDAFYVFGSSDVRNGEAFYNSVESDSMERRAIDNLTRIYANFIAYGNPTPGNIPIYFEPIRNNAVNYIDIHDTGMTAGTDPIASGAIFWDALLAAQFPLLP